MTRAERRDRRQVHIDWRVRLYFTRAGYNWDKQNGWYREPGRLAKDNTACGCLGCRHHTPWSPDRRWLVGPFEDVLPVLRHRNRIFRTDILPAVRRGPGRCIALDGNLHPSPPPTEDELAWKRLQLRLALIG